MRFDHVPTLAEWLKASGSAGERRDAASQSKKTLMRIDDLVARYHRALDMGRLNVLMELRDAIVEWTEDKLQRRVGTSRLSAMRALLDIVLRRLYELEGWGKERYLKVVCAGYEVKTGHYSIHRQPTAEQRVKNERADVEQRVKELIQAIRTAAARYARNGQTDEDRAQTLKIFMAPEFFFRGPYGAYEDIGYCTEILDLLRAETSKSCYADWMFVHGTAVFASEKIVENQFVGAILENYALVQKGGPKSTETHEYVVAKEFPSSVDFRQPPPKPADPLHPPKPKVVIAGRNRTPYSPGGGRRDQGSLAQQDKAPKVSELTGGVLFTMHNIRFGLEVCRDHLVHRLAHSAESGKVQIQLIPSAGMSIQTSAMATLQGGLVFNVDGDTPHVQARLRHGTNALLASSRHRSGNGTICLYAPVPLAWPAQARPDVARRLGLSPAVLSGVQPIAA